MENNKKPLVSIVVITYNSSKYVLETLDSAKAQTYQNIELIVSDDCSTDNTVEICRNWIEENKGRFVRTELITVEKNTGISANCNRGLKTAKGEWIKGIAGDDILLDNCVEDNVNETYNIGSKTVVLFSSVLRFVDNEIIEMTSKPDFFDLKDAESRKDYLNLQYFVGSVSMFVRRSIYDIIGYCDEKYPFMEDYSFIHKVVHNDYSIEYFDKVTVKYRLYSGIYSNNQYVVHPLFFDSSYRFYKDVRRKKIKNKLKRLHCDLQFFKQRVALNYFGNKYTVGYKILVKMINFLSKVIFYFEVLTKKHRHE